MPKYGDDFLDNIADNTPPNNVIPITGRTTTPSADHPLVKKALQERLDELKTMRPKSGRNDALNIAAAYLGRFPIPREQLRDLLLDACRINGVLNEDGHKQCEDTISSGFRKADADGPRVIEDRERISAAYVLDESYEAAADAGALETIEQNFWKTRDELKLIHQAALSRMASPWAVLACCAARILCLVPPAITLPPVIGGLGSLNWFAAISAKSGGGKGAAMAVATKLVDSDDILVRGIGSGEGMIETYQRSSKLKDPPPPVISVLFSIDEIDSLGAMGGRSGQTTMAIVRQGFSGEKLGYSYRGRQSETVSAHTYRMTIVASVQPERAGVLFDDAGGGTPQRFMWFPGRDKRITAHPPKWPTTPAGNERVLKLISESDLGRAVGIVKVPDIIPQEIRQARAASMSGDDNALDSHALFCREKFAYALAVMNGQLEISEEDWRLSGIALAVSDWCRTKAQNGYEAGKHKQSRERGSLRAIENDERELIEHAEYSKHIQRIVAWITKYLTEHGALTASGLNKKCHSRDRPRLSAALAAAAEKGLIVQSDEKWSVP